MGEKTGDLVAGRYRLTALLGEGGMGSAWRALDERLGREVAVKQLRLPAGMDERMRARRVAWMEREARAAAKLRHPGIITVHDQFADADGMPWIVMELIDGRSLDQQVKGDGRLPVERVARICAQVADALAAAHAAGIVHRDLKPANILMDGERVVLSDFGIAALDDATTLTPTGALIGTPAYMAPEQLNGRHATPASDMWSLGATLYYAVEGRPAFTGPTTAALLMAVVHGAVEPPAHAGPLQPVLRALLSKEPGHRPTAAQTAIALRQQTASPLVPRPSSAAGPGFAPSPPPATRPPAPVTRRRLITGMGVAGLAAAVPAAYYALTREEETPEKQPASLSREKEIRWDHPAPLGGPLKGHEGTVQSVAFNHDGTVLATGSDDASVRLWDVAARAPLALPLKGHTGYIQSVAFSPDGRVLATGSEDKSVRLWDMTTRTALAPPLEGHTDSVFSVAFSPDGRVLATGGNDKSVRLWDMTTRTLLDRTLDGHTDDIDAMAFSPDGRILATGSYDKSVRLWDMTTRAPLDQVRDAHDGPLHSMAFNHDGTILATGSADASVRLWDVASRAPLGQPLKGHDGQVLSVAFSPDGRTLATGGHDESVRLWDVASRAPLGRPLTDHTGAVLSVAFGPDGRVLASGSADGSVRLWRP